MTPKERLAEAQKRAAQARADASKAEAIVRATQKEVDDAAAEVKKQRDARQACGWCLLAGDAMTDEGYLKARGWRDVYAGTTCRNDDQWCHERHAHEHFTTAEAVETQAAEDRAVAGYLAARGVPSGHLIAVSSSGGVGGRYDAAVVSRVSGPVGFAGGAPPGLTRVVPETFVEAAKTLASVVLQATREPVSVPWSDVQKAAETVDALDRKPR